MSIQVDVVPQDGTPAMPTRAQKSRHRGDIQGLRAILMAQVLLFHAWTIGSPIGIDSFILISAFLMTSSFVRRSESGHMPFFIERWGNTFKRLLPPLVIVVLTTLAATFLLLPATRWKETTIQAFASVTYWENWRLVDVAADYYANDHGLSSPLQHLWSMSMQGQIFLIWPVLMTLCVLVARRLRISIRKVVVVAFGVIMVASLLWLLFLAPDDGSVYFDTRARIWEFALGSMIAAAAPWLKLGRVGARALTTVSLLVLLVFCLVSIGSYPGPMAFIPMLAVSALMLYVPSLKGKGVDAALSISPLVALGNISYAVYLVHWPIFVIYQAYRGKDSLSFLEGVALISISIIVAWVLTKTVDDPLRKLPWANASTPHKYVVVAVSLAVGLAPIGAAYWWIQTRGAQEQSEAEYDHDLTASENYTAIPESGPGSLEFPGARILVEDLGDPHFLEAPIPSPLNDPTYSSWDSDCSQQFEDAVSHSVNAWCTAFGDEASSEGRVLVAGSSHAQQLLFAQIEPFMRANNLSAYALTRGNCPWTMPGSDILDDRQEVIRDCEQMNSKILALIDTYEPDYAFMVVTMTDAASNTEVVFPGVEELITELTARGVNVIGVRDNLRAEVDLWECSTERPAREPYGGCLLKESDYFPAEDPTIALQQIPGFHMVEYRDLYCVDGVCPTIIGNVFTYFDSNHISGEYAVSMAPFFSARVATALGLDD